MPTHDYDIANQSAPNFRADLNLALDAIQSSNSSATAPTGTQKVGGTLWLDTTNNLLKIRAEDDAGWVTLFYLNPATDTALVESDGIRHAGDTNNSIEFGTDTQNFDTNGTLRMDVSNNGVTFASSSRFNNSGYLGIGELTPSRTIHITDTVPAIRFEDSAGTAYSEIYSDTNGDIYFNADRNAQGASTTINFLIDNVTRAQLSNTGDLDIADALRHYGDTNTEVRFGTDTIYLRTAGVDRLSVNSVGDVDIVGNLRHIGDTDTEISFTTDAVDFRTANASRMDISNTGLRLGGANTRVTTIINDDTLATATDAQLCTAGNVKAYTDTEVSKLVAASNAVGAIAYLGTAIAASLGGAIAFGSTLAGSNLYPAGNGSSSGVDNNGQVVITGGSAMSGTWTCLGYLTDPGGAAGTDSATLWYRSA